MSWLKKITAYLFIWSLVAITTPIECLIVLVVPIFIGLIPVFIAKLIFPEELLGFTWLIGLIEGVILYHYRYFLVGSFNRFHDKFSPWERINRLPNKWLPD